MARVEVVHCPRGAPADCVKLELPPGATLGDALAASGVVERHALDASTLAAGVWGRLQPPTHVLRDGDRVEVYRALAMDAKQARRRRAAGAGRDPSAAQPASGSRTR